MAATDTTVISDYSNFLKEWYLPVIHNARRRKNVFMDDTVTKFDREHIAGEYALIPIEFRSFVGVGNRAENGLMPIPDAGEYVQAKVELVNAFAVFQISLQLLRRAEGERAAFAESLARQTATTMYAWVSDMNRQFLGSGDGYLAMIDESCTDGDTDAKDIDCAWGISDSNAGSDGNGDMFISKNMRINIFNSTTKRTDGGIGNDGTIRISAFTRGSGSTEATITMDDSGTAADGDYIVRDGNKATGSSTTYELTGLRGLIDDGTVLATFQNLAVASYPDWISWIKYGSSPGTAEALTRARMNWPYKNIAKKSGGKVDFLFCGMDTEETYMEMCDSMGITVNQVKLDAASNWEGPEFRGKPIISDPIYPEGRIEYIDRDVISVYENAPADWIPGDVGILQKVANYANYCAEFAWFVQFGTSDRTRLGSLRDIELVT